MPSVTATQVITDALGDLNALQLGDGLSSLSDGGTDALRRLNLLMGQWAQRKVTIPAQTRSVFPLIANKGGSTNPYSIGTGGDLNIPRPASQRHLLAAGLLYGNPPPPFDLEIPRGIMTEEAWQQLRLKNLPSTLFTAVYYEPQFAGAAGLTDGLGSIYLWPVPTDLTNSLVLYINAVLSSFADLTTTYSVPPGYDDALHFNLAMKLAIPYGRAVTPDLKYEAARTFQIIATSNLQISDLENELAGIGLTASRRGWYNIQTGETGN